MRRPRRLHTDVAVVGYGPVGRLLALLLGRLGKRVVVIERQTRAYPLPRAAHFDDEIGRIFQSVGVPPDSLPDTVGAYDDFYEWRTADREPLLRLDWRGLGPSGWHVCGTRSTWCGSSTWSSTVTPTTGSSTATDPNAPSTSATSSEPRWPWAR